MAFDDYLVALLAEGGDRNKRNVVGNGFTLQVALLAEGVDRNQTDYDKRVEKIGSPSSQRAWIEIDGGGFYFAGSRVALLAEGVDRNVLPTIRRGCTGESPSSQRAWIEIFFREVILLSEKRRPPRRGRG